MKINFPLIAFIVLLGWSVGATYLGYQFYQNFSRVADNQTVLLQQVEGLKKETQLTLTPKEFKQTLDSSTTVMMKEMDIKVKNVENQVKISMSAGGTIKFIPRDTIISRNDTLINATILSHKEKFLTVKGLILKNDSSSLTWATRDSLNLLLYWKREGNFLPKLFGKKVYEGAVKGINPYIDYTVNKNIKVQKR